MPTEAQIEAYIARGKQAIKDALAKMPIRTVPSFEDVIVACEAAMQHMLTSSPAGIEEKPVPPKIEAPKPPTSPPWPAQSLPKPLPSPDTSVSKAPSQPSVFDSDPKSPPPAV